MKIPLKLLQNKGFLVFAFKAVSKLYFILRPRISVSYEGRSATIPLRSYLYNDGGWKIHLMRKIVPDGGTLIDIGVNTGQTLIEWKLCGVKGNYVGFEPNYSVAELVADIIAFNKYQDSVIAPFGLSDSNCVKKLFFKKGMRHDSGASIVSDLRPGLGYDIQIVPVYRFDDVVDDLQIQNIDFVKIDVEGAEYQVLSGMKGCIELYKPIILCEILFADENASWDCYLNNVKKMEAFLMSINYAIYRVTRDNAKISLMPIKELPQKVLTKENSEECDYIFAPEMRNVDVYEVP
jgi:FkbM family methyltransferase